MKRLFTYSQGGGGKGKGGGGGGRAQTTSLFIDLSYLWIDS